MGSLNTVILHNGQSKQEELSVEKECIYMSLSF